MFSAHTTKRSPDQGSNGETENEERDTQDGDLLGDAERPHHLNDTAREGRTHEGDGQRSDCVQEGDDPLLPLGECLGVVRVAGEEVDDERIVGRAISGIGVVHNGRVDAGRVEDQREVADRLGQRCLSDLDIAFRLGYYRRCRRVCACGHVGECARLARARAVRVVLCVGC